MVSTENSLIFDAPAHELWDAGGRHALVHLRTARSEGELVRLTQRFAEIRRRPVVLYRVPFTRYGLVWPEWYRDVIQTASPKGA